jgi:uncharacterized OsmC-like protein
MGKDAFAIQYVGSLRTEMTHLASSTRIETDAPLDNHGLGEKFSPTDLVAASVASCMMTIIGIRCQDWGFPPPDMHAKVSKVMHDQPRRIAKVEVRMNIQLDPTCDLPANRTRIRRAAETCPVAQSLHPNCEITLDLNWLDA